MVEVEAAVDKSRPTACLQIPFAPANAPEASTGCLPIQVMNDNGRDRSHLLARSDEVLPIRSESGPFPGCLRSHMWCPVA